MDSISKNTHFQSQRRANAVDTMRLLLGPEYDAERATRALIDRNGVLGSFGVDHVLGNLWARPQLTRRDRSIAVLSFLAVLGVQEEFEVHVRAGLHHGLSRVEVEEVVVQVAAYAGFPMAMQANRSVNAVWRNLDGIDRLPPRPEAEALDDDKRWQNAVDVLDSLFAGRGSKEPTSARSAIVDSLGDVGAFAFDFAFGEVWSRNALSRRDRSLATIAILAVSNCTAELKIHIRGALNHGMTRTEIEEVMVQLSAYGGFPKAVEGMRSAREVFARIDAKQSKD